MPARRLSALALILAISAAAPEAHAGIDSPAPGAVSATTLTLPDKPASVRGLADAASVKVFSAQVSYSIPIALPSGPVGFGPSVALEYSGDLGNGPVGVGWNLETIAIRRSLRNGVPTYTDADELELIGVGPGGRLYTLDGKRYWVEGAGTSIKVDRRGRFFEVTDAAGTRYLLGLTANGVEGPQDRPFAWLVEGMVDVSGQQRIDYTYTHIGSEAYLDAISWGPQVSTGAFQGPAFLMKVELESRPDVTVSWATGYEVRREKRVHTVRVDSYGVPLRRYLLTYLPPDVNFRLSRLFAVRETGQEATPTTVTAVCSTDHRPPLAMPVVSFGYQLPTGGGTLAIPGLEGWVLNQRSTSLFDVDGDGMADLYRMEKGRHVYRKGTGNGFATEQRRVSGAEETDLETTRLMDLDGDSRADLVRIVNDTWRWSSLAPDAPGSLTFHWENKGEWPGTAGVALNHKATIFADINGDKRTDVIEGAAGALLVRLNGQQGLGPLKRLPQVSPVDASVEPGNPMVRFDDINGDHLVDAVWLTDEWMKVWLGRGDGTFVPRERLTYPWGRGVFTDKEIMFVDLDRDGFDDLVRINAGHVAWFPGLPGGGFATELRDLPRPVGVASDAVVTSADVNGNGSVDIVWSTPTGMWALDLAGNSSAGMMNQIDNGMGMLTTFTYSTSALLATADEAAGQPWTHKLPTSIPVPVTQETTYASGDLPRRIFYHVRNGAWDGEERRFAGFLQGRHTTQTAVPLDSMIEEYHFLPGLGTDRVLRGMVAYSTTQTSGGVLFSETLSSWVAKPVVAIGAPDHPGARKPAKTFERSLFFEGVTVPVHTETTLEYDDEVRVTREYHKGRTDMSGDERLVVRRYGSDDLFWVRDRECEEQTFEADESTLVSHERTYYGSEATEELPLCEIGKGWTRRTEALVKALNPNETDSWIDVSRATYDQLGNPTLAYEGGVDREILYDAQSFRAIRETVRPGAGKDPLVWQLSWSDTLTVPHILTDSNNVTTEICYDNLAREQSIKIGDKWTGYSSYDWNKPVGAPFFRPSATTWVFDGDPATIVDGWDPRDHPFNPDNKWRVTVEQFNSGGEDALTAVQLATDRWLVTEYQEYDQRGNMALDADPFYWNQATLPTSRPTIPEFRFNTVHYDAFNRLSRQVLPTGAHKRLTYRAFEQVTTSTDLAPITSRMDGFERIIHTERTVAGILEQVDVKYDAEDRVTEASLQGGQAKHLFQYDTVGRLRYAKDPDIGERWMKYDARNFLIRHKNGANQVAAFFYDGAGRLLARGARDLMDFENPALEYDDHQRNVVGKDKDYVYNYDTAEPGSGNFGNLKSRLAWVQEPVGPGGGTWKTHVGYDVFGHETTVSRKIGRLNGQDAVGQEVRTYSPSGLMVRQQNDDGFDVSPRYDSAGRVIQLGNIWQAGAGTNPDGDAGLDAAGRPLFEKYGSGVGQQFTRDLLGLTRTVRVTAPTTSALMFGVEVTSRTGYGAPREIEDLRTNNNQYQKASYHYDGAARLLDATIGGATSNQWTFRYRYDGLQNLISRFQKGTRAEGIGIISGYYRYGENGKGPRQLTTIIHKDCPGTQTTYDYDLAGRLKRDGDQTMTFDEFDQLKRVEKPQGTLLVEHAYGYDGQRTYTSSPTKGTQFWFTPTYTLVHDPSQPNAADRVQRWHYVNVGDRLVARLRYTNTTSSIAGLGPLALLSRDGDRVFREWEPRIPKLIFFSIALAGVLGFVVAALRRKRPVRSAISVAVACAMMLAPLGCGQTESIPRGLEVAASRVYFHQGVSAGPQLLTTSTGAVLDERRYEPFGQPIDGDLKKDPTNNLNQETNLDTGWSYHGARWLSPQTARWLSPDPPVKGPNGKHLAEPWSLHPYAYVSQSPTLYWDPSGGEGFFSGLGEFAKGIGDGVADMVTNTVHMVAHPIETAKTMATVAKQAYEEGGVAGLAVAAVKMTPAYQLAAGVVETAGALADGDYRGAGKAFSGIAVSIATTGVGAGVGMLKAVRAAKNVTRVEQRASTVAKACSNGSCGIPGVECFAAGTLIATERGPVPIEEIRAGDLVLSRHPQTGEQGFRRVERTFVREAEPTFEVTLRNQVGGESTLRVTPEHPFWAEGRGWVGASQLTAGDQLSTAGDGPVEVIANQPGPETDVYNFEVDGFHTYFVGPDATWVHNACYKPPVNLNNNKAVSHFALYEIKVKGDLFAHGKIGKMDMRRWTKITNLPTRLHAQLRKLEAKFGKNNVKGRKVEDLGVTTTKKAKEAETARLQRVYDRTGKVPKGNQKSFRPK